MKKISYDKASGLLINYIKECDIDELAYIFGDTFGYEVAVDQETDQLECTPNGVCGFILEEEEDVALSDN